MSEPSATAGAPWWELTFEVPVSIAEDVAATLVSDFEAGVQIVDDDNTPPPPANGIWPDEVGERPEPIPQPSGPGVAVLIASFPITTGATPAQEASATEASPASLIEAVIEAAGTVGAAVTAQGVACRRRHDTGWTERWKQFFKPLALGHKIYVVPSWERDFEAPADSHVLNLDPGMAFGTGQHATTALCVEEIERRLAPLPRPTRETQRILDVGCGSGILAIAAAKMGAQCVLAIDNDLEAVHVADENATENGVGQQVECSEAPLANVEGQFDLVVANILASVLIELADELVVRVARGGLLVLSGILASQREAVVARFQQARGGGNENTLGPWQHIRHEQRGEWVCIVLRA